MWQDALRETWRSYMGLRTEWGVLDCCQFVREYARNLTGRDYGADLIYSTEAEANALIAQHGDLLGLLTSILGQPKEEAAEGDLIVVCFDNLQAVGIWQGRYVVGCHSEHGVVRYRAKVVAAWALQ